MVGQSAPLPPDSLNPKIKLLGKEKTTRIDIQGLTRSKPSSLASSLYTFYAVLEGTLVFGVYLWKGGLRESVAPVQLRFLNGGCSAFL